MKVLSCSSFLGGGGLLETGGRKMLESKLFEAALSIQSPWQYRHQNCLMPENEKTNQKIS